jgi:hypothetical protein
MCAGLIAGRSVLRNGLLAVQGKIGLGHPRTFMTPFTTGIPYPFRSIRVVMLLVSFDRTTHVRLPQLTNYTILQLGRFLLPCRDIVRTRQGPAPASLRPSKPHLPFLAHLEIFAP